MVELLVTFILTLFIVLLMAWALARGSKQRYHPSRQQVVELLEAVLAGSASRSQWDLFIGFPLHYDPELDQIRQRCAQLTEGGPDNPPLRSGLGNYLFNREGREQLAEVLAALQQLIAEEPYQRDF